MVIKNNILPFERSYWIIPGKLIAGEYPSSLEEKERIEKLQGLKNAGIKVIINLTEKLEKNHSGIKLYDYSPDFQSSGIDIYQKGIKDISIPTYGYMDEIIELIEECLRDNNPVYFHCWGGVGRTGTVLGCFLLKSKMATTSNVFEYIDYLKRTTSIANRNSPETEEQKAFIIGYSKYLKSRPQKLKWGYKDLSISIRSLLFGVAVGDALGVPVEFKSREELKKSPVTDMIGYGTYNQPSGTWSDDSSLTFCLAEALTKKFSLYTIGQNFIQWYRENYWTPHGEVFDIGITTARSIENLINGIPPELAGGFDENDNGNGSLMRIAPLLFYIIDKPVNERFNIIKQVSSLTHGHIRSVIACFYYLEFSKQIFEGIDKFEIYKNLQSQITNQLEKLTVKEKEINLFNRLLKNEIHSLNEKEIQSSGYVLHTLEASIWCLLTTDNYKDAVLKAVNLGGDTDTTGAVVGGLAGLLYGINDIPKNWLYQISRYDDIDSLAKRMSATNTPFESKARKPLTNWFNILKKKIYLRIII